ncbi:MAG: tetratricopeptide repeat protein [Nitrosomonadales bacterium]|nr:tetratricopeptide repeat protein [Nitrosomonadales bacterium]
MYMLNRFCQYAALCGSALLLCFSLTAHADEIQDINKLFKQGQHEQALERINTYLADKPKDAQARFLKGLILTEQGKTNDAISIFSGLTEDYPELPEPYNNLAVLYAGQGQYDKARVALEMAIRTHPSYATAHENLGDIYAKMASQAYDRALQLDRSNTGTQTKLALIKDLFTGGAAKGGKATHTAGTATSEAKPQLAAAAIPAEAPAPAPDKTAATAAKGAAPLPAPRPPEGRASVGGVNSAQAEVGGGLPASGVPSKGVRSGTPAATQPVAAKKPAAGSNNEVLKAVHGWAAAWSSRNVKRYLAFYAKDFRTPGGESRSSWEAQRSERISKPKSILVSISDPKVKLIDDSHASVSFRQSYRASHLKTSSSKTLVLVKSGGNWLIQEERSGK